VASGPVLGAQTMTTKQNDAAAMTEEQLDGVSGGPHIRNYGVTAPNNVSSLMVSKAES
jgi:hypothetical protein